MVFINLIDMSYALFLNKPSSLTGVLLFPFDSIDGNTHNLTYIMNMHYDLFLNKRSSLTRVFLFSFVSIDGNYII